MASFWTRARESRFGRTASFVAQNRKVILLSAVSSYVGIHYFMTKRHMAQRDKIHPNTWLYWRFFDGSIVEQKTSNLTLLLNSSSPGDEPAKVLTLFEVIRALHWIETDDRITGILADFSSHGHPNVPSYQLGLAQIEEIHDAVTNMKKSRQEADLPIRTLAVTDTFSSQGDYVLATAFDEIYVQPSGDIPLTGLAASIPFWSRLLAYLGIKVHAEARTKWKSMVAPYTQTSLSPDQAENEIQLLSDLNDNLLTLIARARYPADAPADALSKLKAMTRRGPFSAKEAQQLGLINKVAFKSAILKEMLGDANAEEAEVVPKDQTQPRLHGFYHYIKTTDRLIEKSDADIMDVGIVYLMGTISGESGDFNTASVIKGLKEAARDDDIKAVILRIDSGGGGVVESESIWDAVNFLKSKGKVVIASFSNAAASGGYLVATNADLILAHSSTVTGSIGVASLRPTLTQSFLDRFYLNVQSFFMGSKTRSLLHELEGEDLERHRQHIDETYDMFKQHVCIGRQISADEIEALAGGRVYAGMRAFGIAAKPETLEQLARAQNLLPLRQNESEPEAVLDTAKKKAAAAALPIAQLDEDQATSSFATVATIGQPPSEDASTAQTFPGVQKELGPKGRGLIDSLGGIFDAASIGAELGILKALTLAKEEHPDLSDLELIEEVLPDKTIAQAEDGALVFAFDIRLRAFPEERGWWQTIMQAAMRGDAMDPDLVTMWHAGKVAILSILFRSIGQSLSRELEGIGLPIRTLTSSRHQRRVFLEHPLRIALD